MTTFKDYRSDIRAWHWDVIHARAERNVDEEGYGWCYLGDVFSLTPSGKMYMPWATSNLDTCSLCQGRGRLKNSRWRKRSHARLGRKLTRLWRQGNILQAELVREKQARYAEYAECPKCGGHGSAEAYQDILFNQALEQVAKENNMFIGCPECADGIFAGKKVSNEAE